MFGTTMPFFLFSSRRRHTRLQGDWSSDLCSSDLGALGGAPGRQPGRAVTHRIPAAQIGRASCRERGEISVVAVSLKKKTNENRKGTGPAKGERDLRRRHGGRGMTR